MHFIRGVLVGEGKDDKKERHMGGRDNYDNVDPPRPPELVIAAKLYDSKLDIPSAFRGKRLCKMR